MVVTKQKLQWIQKIKRREAEHAITENHELIKENSKRGKKEEGHYKITRKQ